MKQLFPNSQEGKKPTPFLHEPMPFPEMAHLPDHDMSKLVKDKRTSYPIEDKSLQQLDTKLRSIFKAVSVLQHFTAGLNKAIDGGSMDRVILRSAGDTIAQHIGLVADSTAWLLGSVTRLRRIGFTSASKFEDSFTPRLLTLPWSSSELFAGSLAQFEKEANEDKVKNLNVQALVSLADSRKKGVSFSTYEPRRQSLREYSSANRAIRRQNRSDSCNQDRQEPHTPSRDRGKGSGRASNRSP